MNKSQTLVTYKIKYSCNESLLEVLNQHNCVLKFTYNRLVENSKSIEAIYSANQFSQFVNIQTEHLLKQKAELALITEQKREALKKCIQNTDSLQSLKDSQFSEYKKNVRDAENKNIEDIISGRINI